ncbi:6522_t:CDS:2 [Racocetra fulgida]|uniref:6522_t:CDS:1 n=1 Tax=Racocetra fulgida TaxID=60492 RepID=A0A9N9FZ68_9GLOM|nr:6522_t:CDS:2 [Racocetra fulgida]
MLHTTSQEQRDANTAQIHRKRAAETDEQRNQQRQHDANVYRRYHVEEQEEQHLNRQQKNAITKCQRRAEETEDQCDNRNYQDAAAHRQQRSFYHRIGSLLPESDSEPHYLQMYIWDIQNELHYQANTIPNSNLNLSTIQALKDMLDEVNPYAINLRYISYLPTENFRNLFMLIHTNIPGLDQRTYNAPSSSEVAAIWVNNDVPPGVIQKRDIILHIHMNQLVCIFEFSRCYDPLAYPLLFPHSEQSWAPRQIPYRNIPFTNELVNIDKSSNKDDRNNDELERIPEGQHQIQAVLQSLNIFLQRHMKTINNYNLPELLSEMNTAELPKTILEKLSYQVTQEDLAKANTLNEAQRAVFDKVLDLINRENDLIRLRDEMIIHPWNNKNSIDSLINTVYLNLTENTSNTTFITERAILTPLNSDVDKINEKIMVNFDLVPEDNLNLYPVEYLNSLIPQGLPPHELILKIGAL